MLWTPQKGIVRVQTNAAGATLGTSVTTGGSASTKGTPVQLIASTSFDVWWVHILVHGYSATNTLSKGCLDILTGAATEDILIPDLLFGQAAVQEVGTKQWGFPLYIPAGTRIAAQAAGSRTSTALNVMIVLYGGTMNAPFQVGTRVTTYGIGTVPDGTPITPGATGVEGSWTQIAASSSRDHFAITPSFQVDDSTVTNRTFALDLGIGAATEEALLGTWLIRQGANESHYTQQHLPSFVYVPSGTRLVMRASCDGTLDTAYNAAIHGVN